MLSKYCLHRLITPLQLSLLIGSIFLSALVSAAPDPNEPNEPISYGGHGQLFRFDGTAVVPTPEFIGTSQTYYSERVVASATSAQQTEYNNKVDALDALSLSTKNRLYANYRLLKWFITEVNPPDSAILNERNELLRNKILVSNTVITSNLDTLGKAAI